MLTINRLNNFGVSHPGSIAALGSFDGVHLGHQAIIKRLIARAKKTGHDSVVITFDPHPQHVLSAKLGPFLLTSLAEKREIMESLGVGVLAVIKFSKQVAALSPEEFVREILVKKLGVSEVICGCDCGFGAGRRGNINTLKALGHRFGFKVTVLSPLRKNKLKVSSSNIRKLISSGRVDLACRMMGKSYSINGTIVKGRGLGTKLGYPTANLKIPSENKLLPQDGVYIAGARAGLKIYSGMAYIGPRPTFGKSLSQSIEFNAFDSRDDLLGKNIRIYFLKYLRPGRKFKNVESLIKAIRGDEKKSRNYFIVNRSFIST